MGRQVKSRLKVSGYLVATSPIHVGGRGGNMLVDLPLAQNGADQFYIPGTSLAGALRQWMGDVNQLWGYQTGDAGHASAIFVEDAPIDGVISELRDGVGIDREFGAAAEHFKFQRAILPKGTKIPLRLTLEQTNLLDWQDSKAKLAGMLRALEGEHIYLGAAKTRGLGCVELQDLKIVEQNLSNRLGILEVLKQGGAAISLGALSNKPSPSLRQEISITITWQPVGPLMVKAEADGIAVDSLPLTSANGDQLTYVLPGSSIKGALRAQAERIVRTVKGLSIASDPNDKQRFAKQIAVPLVAELFGTANQSGLAENGSSAKPTGKIGALGIADCYAQPSFSSNQWNAVTIAQNETQLRVALDAASLSDTQQAFHVAIDRWTGGAADGLLYSTLEPFGVVWEPIRLRLNLDYLDKKEQSLSIALLLLLLRDFCNGKIPLGYATNRGMGSIKVDTITIKTPAGSTYGFLEQDASSGDLLSILPQPNLDPIFLEWQHWAAETPEVTHV